MPEQFNKTLNPGSENQLAKNSEKQFNTRAPGPDGLEHDVAINIVSLDFDGSFNIPPTSKAVIVYQNKENNYVFELLSFGYVATFEKPKDPAAVKRGNKNGPAYSKEIQHEQLRRFNCRKETMASNKLLWVEPRKNLRCVIPIQGYFEWKRTKEKPAYYVTLKDRPLVFLAGVYAHNYNYNDTEMVKDGDEYLSSFSIVTGPATGKGSNDLLWLHDRKPILLEPNTKEWYDWLTPNHEWNPELLDTALNHEDNKAYDVLTSYEVDKAIGNPSVDGPDNLKPVKKQQRDIGLFFGAKKEPKKEGPKKEEPNVKKESNVKDEPNVKEEQDAEGDSKEKDAEGKDDAKEEPDEDILEEIDDGLPEDGVENEDDVEDDGEYDDNAGGEADDGEDEDDGEGEDGDDGDDDEVPDVKEEVEELEEDEEDDEDEEKVGNVEIEDDENPGEKEVADDDLDEEDVKAEAQELGDDEEVKEDEPKAKESKKAPKDKKAKGKELGKDKEPLAGSKRKSSAQGNDSKRKK